MEKRKIATAISYDPNNNDAPIIKATGYGIVAEKIIETANKNNVPIVEDSPLANTLSKLDLGSAIPVELYDVVAKILVFVSDLDNKKR